MSSLVSHEHQLLPANVCISTEKLFKVTLLCKGIRNIFQCLSHTSQMTKKDIIETGGLGKGNSLNKNISVKTCDSKVRKAGYFLQGVRLSFHFDTGQVAEW